jgi:hypothetical protein
MLARLIFPLFILLAGAAQPPWFGVWKLNPSKSTAADARYKRVLIHIEPWEDGLRVSYDMVGVRGGVTHLEWTGKFDGKDYPIEGMDAFITNAYTLLDDHSYRIFVKSDGAAAATATATVSPDGRTLTTVTEQKDAQGKNVFTTRVYDRQ